MSSLQPPIFPSRTHKDTEQPLTRDEIFGVLSSRRRRQVLHYLKQNEGSATVRDLTEHIAAWENNLSVEETTRQQRKRVYTSLVQNHLPKMADLDVVEHDRDRIILSEHLADVDIYLEVTSSSEMPWSDYYVGLGFLSLVFSVAVGLDVYPFSLIPDIGAAFVVTLLLLFSAGIHMIRQRKRRVDSESFFEV